MDPITLPLFPLSAHILPGGRMSLRIFEPRYVRMVKEACANQTGIGICMLNSQGDIEANQHIHPVGTYVTVEDFDMLDDGLLGITVEGHRCFSIDSITTEHDGLRSGQCSWLDNWSSVNESLRIEPMDSRLKEIFEKYPEVQTLYKKPEFDNPIWVIYRWLELIPVNAEQKQHFLKQNDCSTALKYLAQLVE
jgi:Lon protease-like protein